MEGLSIAVKSAYQQSLFKGIQLPNNGPCLTHLLYVDDAIFIGKWDKGCIKNLARILKCFHISSGLKVNFHKSRLFGIRVTEDELEEQAKILGCLKGVFPFSYLGVSLGKFVPKKELETSNRKIPIKIIFMEGQNTVICRASHTCKVGTK